MAKLHPTLDSVTARIIERSKESRAAYLARLRAAADKGPQDNSSVDSWR
jgi:phosphogluconate dehydratase